MPLTLRVKGFLEALPRQQASATLDRGALTIGRGVQNDLVLPDPERVISKQQCRVEFVDGRYLLTDTSTNGVYLNAADRPIGRGNSVYLKDGDQLRISHYEILIGVGPEVEVAAAAPLGGKGKRPLSDTQSLPGDGDPLDDILRPAGRPAELDPLSGPGSIAEPPEPPAYDQPIPQDSDIWSGGDPVSEPAETPGLQPEHVPAQQEFFEPPRAVPEIPEDWDEDLAAEPGQHGPGAHGAAPDRPAPEPEPAIPPAAQAVPPAPLRAEPSAAPSAPVRTADPTPAAPRAPPPPVEAPHPARAAPAGAAAEPAALRAFLAGAGLEHLDIPDAQAAEVMQVLGTLYREVVQGLMDVLAARSSIKNEFRLSQTTIQPVENNPLKFSLGVEDAMIALLTRRGRGYLPPVRAIQESFDDIKAHQVAVLAGMQVALADLLRRFNPKALEERLEQDRGLSNLLGVKKARYWDAFAQMYRDLVVEAEDDFHSLFGREFARAYEDQVRKLGRRQ
ncbi:MAG: type VI secretion system-associated FHA domain protein TagH [Kiloniellaceae bacterium]